MVKLKSNVNATYGVVLSKCSFIVRSKSIVYVVKLLKGPCTSLYSSVYNITCNVVLLQLWAIDSIQFKKRDNQFQGTINQSATSTIIWRDRSSLLLWLATDTRKCFPTTSALITCFNLFQPFFSCFGRFESTQFESTLSRFMAIGLVCWGYHPVLEIYSSCSNCWLRGCEPRPRYPLCTPITLLNRLTKQRHAGLRRYEIQMGQHAK